MEKLIFRTDNEAVIFDDFENDVEAYRQYWVEMCPCCRSRFESLLEGRFEDNAAQGICSVEGCENEAEYYVDFDMDEVEIEYIEED